MIILCVEVTYEGFDNVVRRRLISTRRRLEAQLDLRQTAITVQPQSSLTIDDYLDMSPDSNTDIDMTVIVTVTARLVPFSSDFFSKFACVHFELKEYNKSPEFFIKKLEHVFSHHTGTIVTHHDLCKRLKDQSKSEVRSVRVAISRAHL